MGAYHSWQTSWNRRQTSSRFATVIDQGIRINSLAVLEIHNALFLYFKGYTNLNLNHLIISDHRIGKSST